MASLNDLYNAPPTDKLIKVSPTDLTAQYLENKLVAGAGVTLTKSNITGVETLTVAAEGAGGGAADGYRIINGTSEAGFYTADGVFQATIAGLPFAKWDLGNPAQSTGCISIGENALLAPGVNSYNVAIGTQCLENTTDAEYNVAVGNYALASNTTGTDNNACGDTALYSNTTGSRNTAQSYCLNSNTTGNDNTSIGYRSLAANVTGNLNVAVGNYALRSNVGGGQNTALGSNALLSNTTANANVAVGHDAGQKTTSGMTNTFVGGWAGLNNTTGGANTAIGYNTLVSNSTGNWNVALGRDAAFGASGFSIGGTVALGAQSLKVVSASDNTAVGYQALTACTTGINNVAVGHTAGSTLTTGSNNVCIGQNAQPSSATVSNEFTLGNTSITNFRVPGVGTIIQAGSLQHLGSGLLVQPNKLSFSVTYSSSPNRVFNLGVFSNLDPNQMCVAVGPSAMKSSQGNGTGNTAVGNNCLENLVEGTHNTALGCGAMRNSVSPNGYDAADSVAFNVAVGSNALSSLTYGESNLALGTGSGNYFSTGSNNIFIGSNVGMTSGSNNILVGGSASLTTISNEITLGNTGHTSLRCAVTSITSLSDQRDKTNIQPLTLGLDFLKKLKPVEFDWNTRDGAKVGVKDFNFIAQDLKAAQEEANAPWLNLVLENNPDKLEATPGRLIPILVKAIQDLEAKLDAAIVEIETLKQQVAG